MNTYFNLSDKVYDVTNKYPELIDLFVSFGFENLKNEMMRKTIGKTISVEMALKMKHIDIETFEKRMVEMIEQHKIGKSVQYGADAQSQEQLSGNINIRGVLPCPIRLQMVEKFESWLNAQPNKEEVNYKLQSASMGLDWLSDHVKEAKTEDEIADIYMSAGFHFFFDKDNIGRFTGAGVFADLTGLDKLNSDFDNAEINLKDPKGYYHIIGVVPAIFMVNKDVLGDREIPRSWEDLLKPEFKDSIAIPMSDLDLFAAVLLGIYKLFGMEGVKALGKNCIKSLHPAQMIKEGAKKTAGTPAVSIMPYFFSWMAKEGGSQEAVWPSEGAIISPIFFLSKGSAKEKIQPVVDFLFSDDMANILSADGKFPSTNPHADNHLLENQKFVWIGWDFIHSNDMVALIKELEDAFYGR